MKNVNPLQTATLHSAVSAARDLPMADATIEVGLLTGGDDRSYALGLTLSLAAEGVHVDFVGSDKLDAPELHMSSRIRFLNLRGSQDEDVSMLEKVRRLSLYYCRLAHYALTARPRVFHVLWNNKLEFFDRTLLMAYYRICGRRVLLTAHNVNAAARDGRDNWLNRFSLRVQYRLAAHIFVHTAKMKAELVEAFAVPDHRISVIPFGINNTAPNTKLTPLEARQRLGLSPSRKVALFFGQIAPYKGLKNLVVAAKELLSADPEFVLVIAGKVKKGAEDYWERIQADLPGDHERLLTRIHHIPDEEVEVFLKAADVLVLPYTHIFQSGVPFLAYSFGLPVVATDVGSLREDVISGETGFVCPPDDPSALREALQTYFASDLYSRLVVRRVSIAQLANERYSWRRVAEITRAAYLRVLSGTDGKSSGVIRE